MAGLGIALGAGADAARSTYLALERNRRDDEETRRLNEEAERRAKEFSDKQTDRTEERTAMKMLSGGVPEDTAAPQKPAGIKVSQDTVADKLPTSSGDTSTGAAPRSREVSDGSASPKARVTASPSQRDSGPINASRLEKVFQATGSPKIYDMMIQARAAEALEKERASVAALRAAEVRARDQALKAADFKLGQEQASAAAQKLVGNLAAFEGMDDNALTTDPKVINAAKGFYEDMKRANSAFLDGQELTINRTNNTVVGELRDAKTGKLVREIPLNTVGDLRRVAQITAGMSSPEMYPQYIKGNILSKVYNENQELIKNAAKAEFETKVAAGDKARKDAANYDEDRALNVETDKANLEGKKIANEQEAMKVERARRSQADIKQLIELTKPETIVDNIDKARELTSRMALEDPDTWVRKYDEQYVDPDTGKVVKKTTQVNYLDEILKEAMPKTTFEIPDAKTGNVAKTSLLELAERTAQKLAEQPGGVTPASLQIAQQRLLEFGVDPRLMPKTMTGIRNRVQELLEQKITADATPKGIQTSQASQRTAAPQQQERPELGARKVMGRDRSGREIIGVPIGRDRAGNVVYKQLGSGIR